MFERESLLGFFVCPWWQEQGESRCVAVFDGRERGVGGLADIRDAELILHLYELRREATLRQAREWFMHQCNPKNAEELSQLIPPGSDANRFFRMVTSYWDMAASFLVRGAVDEQLFLDNCGECLMVWRKLAPIADALRTQRKAPRYLANVEEVFRRFEARRAAQ